MMTAEQLVVAYPVAEDERLSHIAHAFGPRFQLQIEPLVYVLTAELAPAYEACCWSFFALSNGGTYMAPSTDETFAVVCPNGFAETMTADALGITVCLYAYSHLSFSGNADTAQTCSNNHHWLREIIIDHPEAEKILSAIE